MSDATLRSGIPEEREEPADVAALWRALIEATAAQTAAITAGDADGVDAQLARRGALLNRLATRDIAQDVANDPALLPLIESAGEQDAGAGAALLAAQARLAGDLAGLRARRDAHRAFLHSVENPPPGLPTARFIDQHG